MYSTSENGWIDWNVYFDWFKRMFIPSIGLERPVLLIFDRHVSHVSIQVIKLSASTPDVNKFFFKRLKVDGSSGGARRQTSNKIKTMRYAEALTEEESVKRYDK